MPAVLDRRATWQQPGRPGTRSTRGGSRERALRLLGAGNRLVVRHNYAAADNDVFTPPFVGSRVIKGIALDDIADLQAVFDLVDTLDRGDHAERAPALLGVTHAAGQRNHAWLDLLDINFGCPVKKVALKGAGAGVLKDIDLMVRADVEAAGGLIERPVGEAAHGGEPLAVEGSTGRVLG